MLPGVISPSRFDGTSDPLVAAAQAEIDASRRLRAGTTAEGSPSFPAAHTGRSESPDVDEVAATPALPPPQQRHSASHSVHRRSPPRDALEDAVLQVRDLHAANARLKAFAEDADRERVKVSRLLEQEMQRRLAADAALAKQRSAFDEQTAELQRMARQEGGLRTMLSQLTGELKLVNSTVEGLQNNLRDLERRFKDHSDVLAAAQTEAALLRHRLANAESAASTSHVEATEMRHQCETLAAAAEDQARRSAAAEQLSDAQHRAARSALQKDLDTAIGELQQARASASQLEKESTLEVQRLQREVDRMMQALERANTALEMHEDESKRQQEAYRALAAQSSEANAMWSEKVKALQREAYDVKQALESERAAKAALEVQVGELRDVNHLLAVRLKSATVTQEAQDMETEARRLLQRQNEELERQLGELRRTIHSLMGVHGSQSAIHAPIGGGAAGAASSPREVSSARSLARGTHPLSPLVSGSSR